MTPVLGTKVIARNPSSLARRARHDHRIGESADGRDARERLAGSIGKKLQPLVILADEAFDLQ
jgi:hypothetical protein